MEPKIYKIIACKLKAGLSELKSSEVLTLFMRKENIMINFNFFALTYLE